MQFCADLVNVDGGSILHCSISSCGRFIENFKKFADVRDPSTRAGNRPPRVDKQMRPEIISYVVHLLSINPSLFFREVKTYIFSEFGQTVPEDKICRALKEEGWTRKKVN